MSSESMYSTTSITTAPVENEIIVHRDRRGVPYIKASNMSDLYFGQGFVTASDRLWQMDFLRRAARGELAEIFGPNALEEDKRHCIYGFRNLAELLFRKASTYAKKVLRAYSSGVNAFIQTCGTNSLPAEFKILNYTPKLWTSADSLAVSKLLAERLSTTLELDLIRGIFLDLPPKILTTLLAEKSPLDLILISKDGRTQKCPKRHNLDPASFSKDKIDALVQALYKLQTPDRNDDVGSNSWVISGKRTSSGMPILANDPHLPPASPSIWHIVHLSAKHLTVSGVSIPGLPGVMIGHNKKIAWGITNLRPDVQDLYFEMFKNNDPSLFKTPRGWRKAKVRREQIKVRNETATATTQTISVDVKETRHGPILFETGSCALAVQWTALDREIVDLETFLAINRAANWPEFVEALKGYGGPPQNFIYADTEGHIGYCAAGRIPIRKTGDGSVPYDGTTDAGEWVGFIPFDELPRLFNPPSGIIVTANNRLVGDRYPYHITHSWKEPYRARRIYSRLVANRKWTVDDTLTIQADTYSYPDVIFVSELLKIAKPLMATSVEWRELFSLFEGWDGHSNSQSTVLPIATEMRKAFRNHILVGVLGSDRAQLFRWSNEGSFIDQMLINRPLDWLPKPFESYESLFLACYQEAKRSCEDRLGKCRRDWTWGKLASVCFPHPLENLRSIGSLFRAPVYPQNTNGSSTTVNAGASVSMRFVADLSDWNNTRLSLPLGESGNTLSEHRYDQLSDWRNIRIPVLPFAQQLIAMKSRSILKIKPFVRESTI
jgi:penicillin amidase